MKIIPQRDGHFILEPLFCKEPGGQLTLPSAMTQKRLSGAKDYASRSNPRRSFRELVLAKAKKYQGTPYSLGASLEYSRATDCSAFVQYIYQGFEIDLPRCSRDQAQVGKTVTQNLDFSRLLPGDLLFFRRHGQRIGHAGIYMGEGKMIHAFNRRKGVVVSDLSQPYYLNTFVVAKRVFEVRYPN
ncbi:MAG: C40 family peptidase [Desulfobacteraceae bacterium]